MKISSFHIIIYTSSGWKVANEDKCLTKGHYCSLHFTTLSSNLNPTMIHVGSVSKALNDIKIDKNISDKIDKAEG